MGHSIGNAATVALLALGLATAAPAEAAVDLIGATDVTFEWTDAVGPAPVDSYLVFVSRNGAAYASVADLLVATTSATLLGSPGD